ncbi:zinc-dependent metalloprotease [uncultured Friedmanniella sp.]|uniref:zinc-dependent metalloprotease n=1 Tax=uncultured Friedmanniella sp. TaxID=335381 RepID=UPI0035CA9501
MTSSDSTPSTAADLVRSRADGSGRSGPAMVDWEVARSTAIRLVKPGPQISRAGAAEAVAALRASAERAEAYVVDVTGLPVPSATAPVLVVDRPGWISANLDAFRTVLAPLEEKAADKLRPGTTVSALGARATGVEVGVLLSYLAPKVLGQFDPFYPGEVGAPGGRLLLMAPNIVAAERELKVDPADFRLWVCLHEETHRVQFTAVPWLREHLNTQIASVVNAAELDSAAMVQLLADGARRLVQALRTGEEVSIVDLVQTPQQRETIDKITAVMSLLEGHADVVMDSVGPSVVPSVAEIRRRFTVRRQGQGLDKVVRVLLGLDAKMRQYRDGARFCRAVIDEVGMTGLNQVWTAPETLPTRDEIARPERWLARVPA